MSELQQPGGISIEQSTHSALVKMKQIDDKEVSLMYGDSCESTILIDQGPWQI